MSTAPIIEVSGVIHLEQFLKLAGPVEDGAMARILIQSGDVLVNGMVETRRGRQPSHDDMVEVNSPAGRAGVHIHVIG